MLYTYIKKWNLDWLECESAHRTAEIADYSSRHFDERLSTYLVM